MMAKALLIDAAAGLIREVEIGGLASLQAYVGGYIEPIYTWGCGDVLLVHEDEKLLRGRARQKPSHGWIPHLHVPRVLIGNGLVVGRELDGPFVGDLVPHADVRTTAIELELLVEFRRFNYVD